MRALYDKMKEEGTLHILFPQASGVWKRDELQFITLCNEPFLGDDEEEE
jgi:hypothetical protein